MLRWIIGSSLKFRRLIVAIAAGLLVYGILQIDGVRKDTLPEFGPTIVEVQTEALGLSAAEVEQLITVPLEQDLLNGVAFLEEIESASLPGLSSVVMTFEEGTDLLDARQVVAERLTQTAGLPQVADVPQMLQPLSSTGRVAMASLASSELTPIETSVLARWVVVPRLLGVEGVANVSLWGFRDRQLQVLVDPVNLAARDVTLGQIVSTTGNALEVSPLSFLEASSPGTGGFIDTTNQRLHIFHEQAISTPEQLEQVTIEGPEGGAVFVDGQPLTLGDVTQIVEDHQPLIGDALCTGGPCLLLVIEKFPNANTPEVTKNIEAAFDALQPGLPGIEIDTSIYRPATFVTTSITNLRGALLIGGVLLVLVLGAFFFDWRSALISTVSVVMSLIAAGLVLLATNTTVNTMILAGLVMALVVIIDDSIFSASSISKVPRRHHEEGTTPLMSRVIIDSALEMRSVAIYAALVATAALVPFFLMEGEAGAFLPPIALSYLLTIGAALIVSLIVTPAMTALLLEKAPPDTREAPMSRRIDDWYQGVAPRLVQRTGAAVVVFGIVVVAGLVAIPSLDRSLSPALKERDILVQMEAPAGTSLVRMDEITAQVLAEVGQLPGIDNVGAHVGRAIRSDQIVNVNSAEVWAKIGTNADYEATFDSIEATVASHTEVTSNVITYSDLRVTEILDRPRDELVVRVYGDDPDVLRGTAQQVQGVVAGVEGVDSTHLDLVSEEPTLEIEVDLERTQALGIKPGDVRRRAATLVSGIVVGSLFEEQKVFDVVVWGTPEIRQTEADVRNLLIATPSGELVRLEQIADVRVVPNPTVINRESVSRYIDVVAAVAARDIAGIAADTEAAVNELDFTIEHRAVVLGGFAEQRTTNSTVITVGIAALISIFLLLQAAFASWRLAALSFAGLPMALSGGVLAIVLTGGEVTLGSIAGFVAVLALASRGLVVLVRRYQRRLGTGEPFGEDLIVAGTRDVIVPTIISAVALTAVFLPMAILGSNAGLEVVGPMAVVILGGLVTTSLLTVVVLPAVNLRWGFLGTIDTSTDDLFELDLPDLEQVGS